MQILYYSIKNCKYKQRTLLVKKFGHVNNNIYSLFILFMISNNILTMMCMFKNVYINKITSCWIKYIHISTKK